MTTEEIITTLKQCSKGQCACSECDYYNTDFYIHDYRACWFALMDEAADNLEGLNEAAKELDRTIHNMARELDKYYIRVY